MLVANTFKFDKINRTDIVTIAAIGIYTGVTVIAFTFINSKNFG